MMIKSEERKRLRKGHIKNTEWEQYYLCYGDSMIKRIFIKISNKIKKSKEKAIIKECDRLANKKSYDDYRLQQMVSVYKYRNDI